MLGLRLGRPEPCMRGALGCLTGSRTVPSKIINPTRLSTCPLNKENGPSPIGLVKNRQFVSSRTEFMTSRGCSTCEKTSSGLSIILPTLINLFPTSKLDFLFDSFNFHRLFLLARMDLGRDIRVASLASQFLGYIILRKFDSPDDLDETGELSQHIQTHTESYQPQHSVQPKKSLMLSVFC